MVGNLPVYYRHGMRVIFVLLAASVITIAGSRNVSIATDFSGALGDSSHVNDDWSAGLGIGVEATLFLQKMDTTLNSYNFEPTTLVPAASNTFGSQPIVDVNDAGDFHSLHLRYYTDLSNNAKPWNNFHYVSAIDLENGSMQVIDTAGRSNFKYSTPMYTAFYDASLNTAPVFTDFYYRNSDWVAQWSNDAIKLGPMARYHSSYLKPTGLDAHFLMGPQGAVPALPKTGSSTDDYLRGILNGTDNYLRATFSAVGKTADTVVTLTGPHRGFKNSSANSLKATLRWESVRIPMILAIDSHSLPALKGNYQLGVASDANSRVLAAWSDATGQSLTLQAYDNDFADGSVTRLGGTLSIPVTLNIGTSRTDSLNQNFHIRALAPNTFVLTYAANGIIYAQQIDISAGASLVGPAVQISLPGGTCSFPDLSLNSKYAAFSYYRDLGAGKVPEVVRYKVSGGAFSDSLVKTYSGGALTFNTILNQVPTIDQDNAMAVHTSGRVSVAVDTAGRTAIAFNQERNARLVAFTNRKVYYSSADWLSQTFELRGSGVTYPFLLGDSARFTSVSLLGTLTNNATLQLERNGVALPAQGVGPFDATGAFRYRVAINRPDSFTTPLITSASLAWNIKPRLPEVTHFEIGSTTVPFQQGERFDVLNRRDTVKIHLLLYDLDNPANLALRVRTLQVDPATGKAASFNLTADSTIVGNGDGTYTKILIIPPLDIEVDTLELGVSSFDGQWSSDTLSVFLRYRNPLPTANMEVQWKSGNGTLLDSVVSDGHSIRIQVNDSALVRVMPLDLNDDSVTVVWEFRDVSGLLRKDSVKVANLDTALLFSPRDLLDHQNAPLVGTDSLQLDTDTLYLYCRDGDGTATYRLLLIPNHDPQLDTVASYLDTLLGRWIVGDASRSLFVAPGTPMLMQISPREVDEINGDVARVQWEVLLQDPANKSVWFVDTTTTLDTLTYSFPENPQIQLARLRVVLTDRTGVVSQDTLNVVFPRVDTVGGWAVDVSYLQDSLRFVVGENPDSTSRVVEITNIGSVDLLLSSAKTGKEDGAWLDYQILWGGLAPVQEQTQTNSLSAPIRISPNEKLSIRLSFDVSAMSGDQTIVDTLYLGTSDFLSPQVMIPFRVRWDDLPTMRILSRSSLTGQSQTLTNWVDYFPAYSSLVFVFSEPILHSSIGQDLQVYSRLDSTARGVAGISPIESQYSNTYLFNGSFASDTIVFTPRYLTASDYFNSTPPPGSFVRADDIGVLVGNAITDTAGNPLDIRRNKALLSLGSLDTIFHARVDTSTLRVVQTWPADGDSLNPDEEIRILFSKPLTQRLIVGTDTIPALDLQTLEGDSNSTVELRSRYSRRVKSDFRALALERGDSVLVLRPRYKFLSDDSVLVRLSASIASPYGHTLDGNEDGRTAWPADTVDDYTFHFVVGPGDFYAFPNPWKASIAEHREKGSITFKNLHQIKGVNLEENIEIRIYTMNATLVFSTERKGNSFQYDSDEGRAPLFDWNLRNNHGNPVASGSYLYTVSQRGKVLFKSKVMVIR